MWQVVLVARKKWMTGRGRGGGDKKHIWKFDAIRAYVAKHFASQVPLIC